VAERSAWLVGGGRLHERLRELAEEPRGVALETLRSSDELGRAAPYDLVVSAFDGWNGEEPLELQREVRSRRLHLLPCRLDGGLGLIGPWVHPLRPGCLMCAEWRRSRVLGLSADDDVSSPRRGRPAAHPGWLDALARVAMETAARDHRPPLLRRVYALRADNLFGRWHMFTQVPQCPECGSLPDDSPLFAEAPIEPHLQPDSTRFRVQSRHLTLDRLRTELCDWRLGLVPHTYRVQAAPLALAVAEIPLHRGVQRESGYGRGVDYGSAELVALLEALERHASSAPGGRRTVVRGSFEQLAGDALDPTSLGLPDPCWQGAKRDAVVYSRELVLDWVWGWSLGGARPTLVPEQVAYYGSQRSGVSPRFCYESSNGCAIGSSLEEAVLQGLFEVIERDCFLMTWYARLPAIGLDLNSIADPATSMLVDRAEALGYRVLILNISNDLGVPAIWSLVYREQDDDLPKSYSAAAAHANPALAVRSALAEAVVNMQVNQPPGRVYDRDRLASMYRAPELVATLEDHVGLYTLPLAFERLAFLASERPCCSLSEAFPEGDGRWRREDLTESLLALVGHLRGLGLDVIVVDQTSPELKHLRLRTVKVIVPGTLPMTFGHTNHRTRGLPRLLEVPARLGHWPAPKSYQELEILPHPFP
jgi:ribosomal protein S12 methylthiotransferase accessory factor